MSSPTIADPGTIPLAVLAARDALLRAMEVAVGDASPLDGEKLYSDNHLILTSAGFDFRTPGGVTFSYRHAEQLKVSGLSDALKDEAALFQWGTVFGGVAWLHDLIPIHASAVSKNGRAVAFSAESGGGKSTLSAALSKRGFAHICDDTMVLVPDGEAHWALPDGKPLKLWDDALRDLGADGAIPIEAISGKNYLSAANPADQPSRLTDLIFIERGNDVGLEPVEGGAKLELLAEALYRGFIHAALAAQSKHAGMMLQLAQSIRFWRLQRPMRIERFNDEMDEVAALLRKRLMFL